MRSPFPNIYHACNRAGPGRASFRKPEDFQRFESLLADGRRLFRMKIFSYCLMENHWHLIAQAPQVEDFKAFLRWLMFRHGMGFRQPLFEEAFALRTIFDREHFLRMCRYVERNALTAGLVERAEEWRWSSLWVRGEGPVGYRDILLDRWPQGQPDAWRELVNRPFSLLDQKSAERRGAGSRIEQNI